MKLYIISRPKIDFNEVERFFSDERIAWRRTDGASAPDELVELAGRICYMSFGDKQSPKSNAEYIENLIIQGHESVLEHAVWTFIVTGVSRAFSHQLVRHRVGLSYSQLSQQYHDEHESDFVAPNGLDTSNLANEWHSITKELKFAYKKLKSEMMNGRDPKDIPKEELRNIRSITRSILPNAIETKIAVTGNVRALRHFIKLRGTIEGDMEMRTFSCCLLEKLKVEAPSLFLDLEVVENESDRQPIVVIR